MSQTLTQQVAHIATATLEEFTGQGQSMKINPEDVVAFDEWVGAGYGVLDGKIVEAIRMCSENEGLLLDPVYTAKAMAGLLDLHRKQYFEEGATGGTPALFSYGPRILAYLDSNPRLLV